MTLSRVLTVVALCACAAGCPERGNPDDLDDDGVRNESDVAPEDPWRCTDGDQDGCDDCAVKGRPDTGDDGFDADADGRCELALDTACLHARGAAQDPSRRDACTLMAFANADRALFPVEAEGARPLLWDEGIWEVAIGHSRDMCDRSFYAHTNPDGRGPTDRARARGEGWFLSENIHAVNDHAVNDLVQGHHDFMAEPTCTGHRRNILDARAIRAAVGVFHCTNAQSSNHSFRLITQNFHVAFSLPQAPFCQDPLTACEVPANPVSSVVAFCAAEACFNVDASVLQGWDCPED